MKKLLIFVYCTFLLFLVGSAVYASKTFDGAIANSYKKGMEYPKDMARLKEKGWSFAVLNPQIKAGAPAEIGLLITDKTGQPVTGAHVELEISRLTMPETLPVQEALEGEGGRYAASVQLPVYGHWQVQARVSLAGDTVQHLFKIYADEGAVL